MNRCKHKHIKELYADGELSVYASCLDCGKTIGNPNLRSCNIKDFCDECSQNVQKASEDSN